MSEQQLWEKFEAWWKTSKYTQVVFASDEIKQCVYDGWVARHREVTQ